MLLRLIEDGKPENFQQQIYGLLGSIANHIYTSWKAYLTAQMRKMDRYGGIYYSPS